MARKLSVLASAQCFLGNGSLTEGWCFVLVLINGTRVPQFASVHALGSGDVGRTRTGWWIARLADLYALLPIAAWGNRLLAEQLG